ncbi:uncharacterized protein LOC109598068 isoform X2 [Aethina tumida]|uniref:uncharacterized protein LOC109598068 isoform X2 n=1 Tax=Aethina tumida TaxID=116153 RepID=UPI0021476FEB|nr:uncharacterized protein LOC109598068 isoform X2 [Aethina tumida]
MTSLGQLAIFLALFQFYDLSTCINTNTDKSDSSKFSNINERLQVQVSGSTNINSKTKETKSTDNKLKNEGTTDSKDEPNVSTNDKTKADNIKNESNLESNTKTNEELKDDKKKNKANISGNVSGQVSDKSKIGNNVDKKPESGLNSEEIQSKSNISGNISGSVSVNVSGKNSGNIKSKVDNGLKGKDVGNTKVESNIEADVKNQLDKKDIPNKSNGGNVNIKFEDGLKNIPKNEAKEIANNKPNISKELNINGSVKINVTASNEFYISGTAAEKMFEKKFPLKIKDIKIVEKEYEKLKKELTSLVQTEHKKLSTPELLERIAKLEPYKVRAAFAIILFHIIDPAEKTTVVITQFAVLMKRLLIEKVSLPIDQFLRWKIESLSMSLPLSIRYAVMSEEVYIFNVKYQEYFYASHNLQPNKNRYTFTWVPKVDINNTFGEEGGWKFFVLEDKPLGNFTIRNKAYNDYLMTGGSIFGEDVNTRLVLTRFDGNANEYGRWTVEPCQDLRYLHIRNYLGEYLYAVGDDWVFDNKRRRVYSWITGTNKTDTSSMWQIFPFGSKNEEIASSENTANVYGKVSGSASGSVLNSVSDNVSGNVSGNIKPKTDNGLKSKNAGDTKVESSITSNIKVEVKKQLDNEDIKNKTNINIKFEDGLKNIPKNEANEIAKNKPSISNELSDSGMSSNINGSVQLNVTASNELYISGTAAEKMFEKKFPLKIKDLNIVEKEYEKLKTQLTSVVQSEYKKLSTPELLERIAKIEPYKIRTTCVIILFHIIDPTEKTTVAITRLAVLMKRLLIEKVTLPIDQFLRWKVEGLSMSLPLSIRYAVMSEEVYIFNVKYQEYFYAYQNLHRDKNRYTFTWDTKNDINGTFGAEGAWKFIVLESRPLGNFTIRNKAYNEYLRTGGSVFRQDLNARMVVSRFDGNTNEYGKWTIEPCQDLRYVHIRNYLGEYMYADDWVIDNRRRWVYTWVTGTNKTDPSSMWKIFPYGSKSEETANNENKASVFGNVSGNVSGNIKPKTDNGLKSKDAGNIKGESSITSKIKVDVKKQLDNEDIKNKTNINIKFEDGLKNIPKNEAKEIAKNKPSISNELSDSGLSSNINGSVQLNVTASNEFYISGTAAEEMFEKKFPLKIKDLNIVEKEYEKLKTQLTSVVQSEYKKLSTPELLERIAKLEPYKVRTTCAIILFHIIDPTEKTTVVITRLAVLMKRLLIEKVTLPIDQFLRWKVEGLSMSLPLSIRYAVMSEEVYIFNVKYQEYFYAYQNLHRDKNRYTFTWDTKNDINGTFGAEGAWKFIVLESRPLGNFTIRNKAYNEYLRTGGSVFRQDLNARMVVSRFDGNTNEYGKWTIEPCQDLRYVHIRNYLGEYMYADDWVIDNRRRWVYTWETGTNKTDPSSMWKIFPYGSKSEETANNENKASVFGNVSGNVSGNIKPKTDNGLKSKDAGNIKGESSITSKIKVDVKKQLDNEDIKNKTNINIKFEDGLKNIPKNEAKEIAKNKPSISNELSDSGLSSNINGSVQLNVTASNEFYISGTAAEEMFEKKFPLKIKDLNIVEKEYEKLKTQLTSVVQSEYKKLSTPELLERIAKLEPYKVRTTCAIILFHIIDPTEKTTVVITRFAVLIKRLLIEKVSVPLDQFLRWKIEGLSMSLPPSIRYAVMSEEVYIFNVKYQEYFYEFYKVQSDKNRQTFEWIPNLENNRTFGKEGGWKFGVIEDKPFGNFTVRNKGYNDYLMAGGAVYDRDYNSRKVLSRFNGNTYDYGRWTIEPCQDLKYLHIRNYLGEYMYAVGNDWLYDKKRRRVYTWIARPNTTDTASMWQILPFK